MRIIITLFLLLTFSSAYAYEEEAVQRYKDVGLENGKIVADFYISPMNDTLHFFFRLKPELIDELARANGIIDKNDTLWNFYSLHEQKIYKERALIIERLSFAIFSLISLIALQLSIISALSLLLYHMAGENERNEQYDKSKALKWFTGSMTAVLLLFPNVYKGIDNLAVFILADSRFIGLGFEQLTLSSITSGQQRQNFILDTSEYKGASENSFANYLATNLVNNMSVYLQSEKNFHRNTHTNKLYEHPEKFIHTENEFILFYMSPNVHNYKKNTQLLYKAGSYDLTRVKLDQNTADKIYPIQIIPTTSESEIASGWKVYEAELKKKFSDKYEDSATYIRLASFYYHYNSYVNVLEKKLVALAPTKALKAAEFLEAYACENDKERRFDARKAVETGNFERNYCLYKNGNSIAVTAESGNLNKAITLTNEIADEIKQLLLTTNKSLYESVKFSGVEKLLIEATQRGSNYYFRNAARIKQAGMIDNQLARYLNNGVTAKIVGKGFFIDDSNLESRVNSTTPLNLDIAYQEYISNFSILPSKYADSKISKRFENYASLKSSTDEQTDSSSIYSTVMSIINTYEDNYNLNNITDFTEMEEPNLAAQKFGLNLQDIGVDIISVKLLLGFVSSGESAKASKAKAKNFKGMGDISFKDILSFGQEKIISIAQKIVSALDFIAITAIGVGIFYAYIVPYIHPILHFVSEQAILLNHTVLLLFPSLILLRLFNKNDADNWRYIKLAITSTFFSLIFMKLFIDSVFYLVSETSGYALKLALFNLYDAISINTDSSNPIDVVKSCIFFLTVAAFIQWMVYTTLFKLYFTAMLTVLRKLHINDDFLNIVLKALGFIDMLLSILCPLIWILSGVRKAYKKSSVVKDKNNKEKGEAKQKTPEPIEEQKAAN